MSECLELRGDESSKAEDIANAMLAALGELNTSPACNIRAISLVMLAIMGKYGVCPVCATKHFMILNKSHYKMFEELVKVNKKEELN